MDKRNLELVKRVLVEVVVRLSIPFALLVVVEGLLSGCSESSSNALSPEEQAVVDAMREGQRQPLPQHNEYTSPPVAPVDNDPHGLNGRWEREGRAWFGDGVLVFDGDSVVSYQDVRFYADRVITNEDLGSGGFNVLLIRDNLFNDADLGVSMVDWVVWGEVNLGMQGVTRDLVSVERVIEPEQVKIEGVRYSVDDVEIYEVIVRERREATFVQAGQGGRRFEFLWEDSSIGADGWISTRLFRVVNALAPDTLNFENDGDCRGVFAATFHFVE
jgi:hypothetical protein